MGKKILLFLLVITSLHAKEVYAIFNIEAVQDADLMLDSNGIIQDILVEVGDKVKLNDVLLKLQNEDKIDNIMIQKANSDSILTQLSFAKKQYLRYLKIGRAIDRNTLDKYFSDYKQLEANFLQSKYNIKLQKALLAKTILTAPFDGVIASKDINVGDGVVANNTKLLRIISLDRKLVLQFDSRYIKSVKLGDVFKFKIDGSGKVMQAKITKIYPAVDVDTRKVLAEALVGPDFMPGLFGDGFITTRN